jgi:hypothetical protein
LFGSLKGILLDEDDARHVFQAAKNEVAYFVTADERSILRFREAVERSCRIAVVEAMGTNS